jgi:hypothetical protein
LKPHSSVSLDSHGLPLLASGNPWSFVAVFSIAFIGFVACAEPRTLGPAPYVSPAVGTVYTYAGFKNTVLASNGWRVRFADDSGRQATHVALFITDDPKQASQIDSTALVGLWPLENGKQAVVMMRAGSYTSRWLFRVMGQAPVAVPAGTFDTYVVQAVQRPEELTDPRKQTVFEFTWWYAPAISAVAQFETRYASGPQSGHVVRSVLRSIDTSQAAVKR